MNTQQKRCSHCLEYKALDQFGKDKNRADGLYPQCRNCKNRGQRIRWAADPELRQAKAEYQRNKLADPAEFVKQKNRLHNWYEHTKKDPEKLERMKALGRARDRKRRVSKVIYNAEHVRSRYASDLKYRMSVRDYFRARTAKKRSNGGSFTREQWQELVKRANGCCACGSHEKLEADHIVPVSLGGSSDITNIQPLCRSCNASKSQSTRDYRSWELVVWAIACT